MPSNRALFAAGSAIVAYMAFRRLRRVFHCNAIQRRKQAQRAAALTVMRNFVSEDPPTADTVAAICSMTSGDVLESIKTRKANAVSILRAFVSRTLAVQDLTNCLTEIPITEAIETAKKLDAEFAATGKVVGVLHGVPLCVKDSCGIKGYDMTYGYFDRCFKPMSEDCNMVARLKTAGAVVFAKTNTPLTMMSCECDNTIFGRATHPLSMAHSCGGSSGGEGAMMAMDGAVFGIGSDIAGSIRMPAHHCGIYGLRPTAQRIGAVATGSSYPGQEAIAGVPGPMGRNVDDLVVAMRVLLDESYRGVGVDGNQMQVSFREDQFDSARSKKLRVGFYLDDGLVKAAPPCRRAVQEAVDALRQEGHTVVPFSLPDVQTCTRVYYALWTIDGYDTMNALLNGQALTPIISKVMNSITYQSCWAYQWLQYQYLARVRRDPVMADLMWHYHRSTVSESFKWLKQRNYVRHLYVQALHSNDLDVVIAPGHVIPAVPNDKSMDLYFGEFQYTALYNLYDVACGSIPVTTVNKAIDHKDSQNTTSLPSHSPMMDAAVDALYDPELMHGFPVGIQVAGRRCGEEAVLGAMVTIDNAVRKHCKR